MNDFEYENIFSTPSQPEQPAQTYTRPAEPVYVPSAGHTPPEPPQKPRKQKKSKKPMGAGGIIALCLICSLLAAILASGATFIALRNGNSALGRVLDEIVPTEPPQLTVNSVQYLAESAEPGTASYVYELARRQVVGISTEISYTNIFGQVSASSVTGSGFIIDSDGYIMTNYHVIEDAQRGGYEVTVLTYDGTEYTAKIVGYDEENDIAVLKIDAAGLSAAELGDSDQLVVGQMVYAVGNPLGELNYTMTSGIVSATDRAITTSGDSVPISMFQMDAAVNSGNSGGPVYNAAGQVVGVVTAKTSATGVEGLGFAIPISDAAHIANQILEYGYVTDRASLGITSVTVPSSVAARYNMVEGAYVNAVNEGSAAETAGLQTGDIITAVDDQEVAGSTELTGIVHSYQVGDTAQLTVWRAGETITLTVTFDQSQPVEEAETTTDSASGEPDQGGWYSYGYGDFDDFFRQFFSGFGF